MVLVVVHVPAAAALHGAAAIGASWNGVVAGAPGESKKGTLSRHSRNSFRGSLVGVSTTQGKEGM